MDSVGTAFELMSIELKNAVENLNAEGAQLFVRSNYEGARLLTAKGAALLEFCSRVEALSREWTEKYSEQASEVASVLDQTETTRRILSTSKAARTGLMVKFPDGTIICEERAAVTLVEAIKKIGPAKVEALGISVNGENIVSRKRSIKYNDVFISPYYIKSHSSTEQKKRNLERISQELGLSLRVDVMP